MRSKLLENLKQHEDGIKKRNPNASLEWRADYDMALETCQTPHDFELIHNMSIGEFYEYVLHLKGARSKAKRSQKEEMRGKPGRRHWPEDLWAWDQMWIEKRDPVDVKREWEKLPMWETGRKPYNRDRQWNRIKKKDWKG